MEVVWVDIELVCEVAAGSVEDVESTTYWVTIGGCSRDEADTVMAERLGFDEDYGFGYTLSYLAVAGRDDVTDAAIANVASVPGEQGDCDEFGAGR